MLGVIGSVGAVGGNDANASLRVLNRMLDGWRLQPHLAVSNRWLNFVWPAGVVSQTIGTGGDVNVERPVSIEIGSYTETGGISRPLQILTRDQYASILLKNQSGDHPAGIYYDAASPLGTAYVWPAPGAGVTANLAVRTQFTKFADLTTEYTLPDGYEAAFVPNLAVMLGPVFERAIPPDVRADARITRAAIKRKNAQVPELTIGNASVSTRYGRFLAGE